MPFDLFCRFDLLLGLCYGTFHDYSCFESCGDLYAASCYLHPAIVASTPNVVALSLHNETVDIILFQSSKRDVRHTTNQD